MSRCRNGAVWAEDVAFNFQGVDIKILSSLMIPREVSLQRIVVLACCHLKGEIRDCLFTHSNLCEQEAC